MKDVQSIYNNIEEKKSALKDLRAMYIDALSNSLPYQKVVEKMKTIRDEKIRTEDTIKASMGENYIKMDELKSDLNSDKELLNDAALSKLMSGETVEIKDKYDNQYEPIFSVRFKKVR